MQSDIVKNFIENHWKPREKEIIDNAKTNILDNYESITQDFVDILLKLFSKIVNLQEKGVLGDLKYIDCSFLYTSFFIEKPIYRLYAYDDKTVMGDDTCFVEYKVDWLFKELITVCNKFVREKNNYNIFLTPSGIKILPRLTIPKLIYWFYCLAKYAIRKAVDSDEFKAINKADILDVYCGAYNNNPFNIYKYSNEDININKKIKEIKNVHENKSLFGVFNGLKITNIDFSDIDFRFSRFNKCSFVDCNFQNNILDDVEFIQCQISRTKFVNCRFYGINFSKSVFNDAQFVHINQEENYMEESLTKLVFKNISFSQCVLKNIIFDNVYFKDVLLEKSGFNDINIQNSDFSNSGIKNYDIVNLKIHNTQL